MTEMLFMPLLFQRDGLDPIAELGERRATEPVSKLELPFGITAWLVTGYDEAKDGARRRELRSATPSALTIAGTDDEQDPGGLGMTDPPYHTRLRKMLTPEFTMRRLQRLSRASTRSSTGLLDAIEHGRSAERPGRGLSRCRSRRW